MKEIKAFVKPFKVNDILNQLLQAGYPNTTVSLAEGTGSFKSDELSLSTQFSITDSKVAKIEIVCNDSDVDQIVSVISTKELTATVFAIGKEFEANSRAVHIHAKINEKVSGLIPGMYISGHLHTDEKYTRALPNDAIVSEGTKSFIFILDNEAIEEQGHSETEHAGHDEDKEAQVEEGNHEGHEHGDADDDDATQEKMAFRMVEVIPGLKDEGYTEIQLINSLPENTQVVLNAAYYLLADMKKEETEHEH